MNSLRQRLLLGLIGGNAVLAVLTAGLLWTVAQRAARSELDRSLQSEVGVLANMCRIDEHGETYLDVDPVAMPWFGPGPDCHYFRVSYPDGRVVQLSPSLGGKWGVTLAGPPSGATDANALPDLGHEPGVPHFADLALPDGRSGRAVGLRIRALPDWDPDHPPEQVPELPELNLALARDRSAEREALASILPAGLALVTIWPFIGALLAWWTVRHTLRPLDELGAAVASIDPTRPGSRIAAIGTDELRGITSMINALLARVEVALGRERRFAGMAAHELRTPLASVSAAIEIAAGDPADRAAQERLHRDGLAELQRMQRQLDSLLSLARAQVGAWQVGSTDLVAAIQAAIARQGQALAAKGITLTCCLPNEALLRGSVELTETMVGNLFSNLVDHAPPSCVATCVLVVGPSGWILQMTNPAPLLHPDDGARLAEPWFRAGKRTGGSGLGLAIAAAAAQALGGDLACTVANGMLQMVISLPRQTGVSPDDADRPTRSPGVR